jgi:exonuclease SbcD
MRLAHLADTHLGFKQFTRTTLNGRNVREQDVINTFRRVLSMIPAVDAILVAGDVFHVVHPSNAVIGDGIDIFDSLRQIAPVVIVAGNHETPRTRDMGEVLRIIGRLPNITIIDDGIRTVDVAGIRIVGVPEAFAVTPEPFPAGDVLLLHGEVTGAIPRSHSMVTVSPTRFDAYQYTALGHYHVAGRVGTRAYYAGSLDYVSTNPWEELSAPKSFYVVELGTEPPVAIPSPITRRFIDLPRVDATGFSTAMITEAADTALRKIDTTDAVIRHVMVNVPRHIAVDVKPPVVKAAFNYRLDLRRPDATEALKLARETIKRLSIPELLRMKIEQSQSGRDDISHEDVFNLGLQYMEQADERDRNR